MAKRPVAEVPTTKRLTLDVAEDLHQRIKLASVMKRENMADTLREVLMREFPPPRKPSGKIAARS
jgi:hypothetical protein